MWGRTHCQFCYSWQGNIHPGMLITECAEIEQVNKYEETVHLSHGNRSLAEAFKLNETGPQDPARNYYKFVINLAMFSALLHVLFRNKCEYFEQVFDINKILWLKWVKAIMESFQELRSKETTWAIMCERQSFFNMRFHPKHNGVGVNPANIPLPTSQLQDNYLMVMFAQPIWWPTFPVQWRQHLLPPPKHPSTKPPLGANQFTRTHQQNQGYKFTHIHPTIYQMVSEHHTKFKGWIMSQCIIQATGNVNWRNIPYLRWCFTAKGWSHLCYNYVLGHCMKVQHCEFVANGGHPEHHTLPLDFMESLCRVLCPGVDSLLCSGSGTLTAPTKIRKHPRVVMQTSNHVIPDKGMLQGVWRKDALEDCTQ